MSRVAASRAVSRATTSPFAARRAHGRREPRSPRRAVVVGARVVDDQDVVGRSRLGAQGIEATRQEPAFVVGADDRGNRQPHAVVFIIDHRIAGGVTARLAAGLRQCEVFVERPSAAVRQRCQRQCW